MLARAYQARLNFPTRVGKGLTEWAYNSSFTDAHRSWSKSRIAIVSRKMPLDLHCIVQDAADSNHVSACEAIEQEMPGPVNDATLVSRPVAAVAKMVAAHIVAKFWPTDASGSVRTQGYVAKRRDEKPFVTQSSRFSEMLLRPRKNIDDVRLRGIGEAIIGHKAMRRPCGLGFQPPDRADRYNLLARRLAHL